MSAVAKALSRLGAVPPFRAVAIGTEFQKGQGEQLAKHSPIDGQCLARLELATAADCGSVFDSASHAFSLWRDVPAPERGRVVRRLGEVLREHQDDLATLVSWEAGKVTSEARGEVQEMIDICDLPSG